MTKLPAIDPTTATGQTRTLLDGVQAHLGIVPNLMRTLANSSAALEGYLQLNAALAHGRLGAPLRERIALAVAEANGCDYCLAAHTAIGTQAGLTPDELAAARLARSTDPRSGAALAFARALVEARGQVTDESLNRIRAAGFSDGEIVEIVAEVALNVLTNYVNITAGTEVDFPPAAPLASAA